jgi:metal-responsive CopG/Arc/MetJ family transcriptional regulator
LTEDDLLEDDKRPVIGIQAIVTIEGPDLALFDRLIARLGYKTRQEAVATIIRDALMVQSIVEAAKRPA